MTIANEWKRGNMISMIRYILCFAIFAGCGASLQTVKNTTDQSKLAEIAMNSSDTKVRCAAVERLTTEELRAKIALNDADPEVRRIATGTLTDQKILTRIAIEDNDAKVRSAALWKITDQDLLAKIAVEAKSEGARKVAMMKLTDRKVLSKFSTENKDDKVRIAAVGSLTDQAELENIAMTDAQPKVRIEAVKKLTGQAALSKIALTDADSGVRNAAVSKLDDQALLMKIAKQDSDGEVRGTAVDRMSDQREQAKIALEDVDWRVRSAAVMKMIDRTALARVMREDKDEYVCEAAYERLNDLNQHKLLSALKAKPVLMDNVKSLLSQQISKEELSSALFYSVKAGDINMCNMLLEAGADINSRDGYNDTPVMIAIKSKRQDVALSLINSKADIALTNKKNINALFLSAYNTDISEALIDHNARITDISVADSDREYAAFTYQWLAVFLEKKMEQKSIHPSYADDVKHAYGLAAKLFEQLSDYYSSEASWDTAKSIVAIVALSAASSAVTAGNQKVAKQQANEMAQYNALRSASSGGSGQGTGIAFYQVVNFTPGDSIWNSARTNKDKARAASELASKCKKKHDCYNTRTDSVMCYSN